MNDNHDRFVEEVRQLRREIQERIDSIIRYGAETAAVLDKTLVTLSAGALVFSMTFADKLAPAKIWLPMLFISWIAFGATILSVVFSVRTLQIKLSELATHWDKSAKDFEQHVARGELPTGGILPGATQEGKIAAWNQVAIWSFFSGIVLLGIFVSRNLLAG
jgi:hypothetical protein